MEKKIFNLETLLISEQFEMINYPETPLEAFNPAAYVDRNDKLVILPRLVFDTRFYVSSVGLCEPISFDKLADYNFGAKQIKTRLLKYPTTSNEMRGVEDPRITEDGKRLLTVGLGKTTDGEAFTTQTTMSKISDNEIVATKPFLFEGKELQTGRDAVFINDKVLLFRPEIKTLQTYRAFYEETDTHIVISNEGLIPILELDALKNERKRGVSTNVVKLSTNEYIVGYHAAFDDKLEYKEGFMLVTDNGEVTETSKLMLKTEGILQYGHRPFTLFGCGLVIYKDKLFFVGGVGDSWIGIFSAELSSVLERIKKTVYAKEGERKMYMYGVHSSRTRRKRPTGKRIWRRIII